MVPNIARDASTSRNIAVLCQELFGFPVVTLTLSSDVFPLLGRVIGLFASHALVSDRIVSFSSSPLSPGLDWPLLNSLWLQDLKHAGWILDLYHKAGQMVIWLKKTDGSCVRLTDPWKPKIHVGGSYRDLLDLAC